MKAVITFLMIFIPGLASAQFYDRMYLFSWNVNQPFSNTDFIGNTSVRGMRFGYRELINEKFTIGADLLWSSYDDYTPRQTYYSPNSAITTDFFNYANTYGATLSADYYFFTERKVMPYVGFGAGVSYNAYKIYYNVFSSGENAFGVLLRPQAGVWVKFNEQSNKAFHAGVHFDYASCKSEDAGYRQFINAGIELGLVILDW